MMRQEAISRALIKLRPGAEWVLRGEQYNDLEWLDQSQPIPDEAELIAAADDIQVLPDVPRITKAQALLYLLSIGKTEADVLAAIESIDDATERTVAEIEWRYREPFRYDYPMFAALGPLLGISDMVAAFCAAALL